MTLTSFTAIEGYPRDCHFVGTFRATRPRIVKAFGPPNSKGDVIKTSSEWVLKTPSAGFVAIYDDRDDYPSECAWSRRKHIVVKWHLAATNSVAAEEVAEGLGLQINYFPSKPKNPRGNPETKDLHEARTTNNEG